MRKIIALILLGLGSFLLVTAVLATVWAPGVVKKTPIDINTTTVLSGEAQRLDSATGELGDPVDIRIVSITQADGDASDDDVVVFLAGSCVVENEDGNAPDCVDGEDPRLVTADENTFATDRVTALAVDNGDYLPDDSEQYEGLVNKWPFDAEKKTYPYWDGTIGEPVDAVFDGTETIEGVDTYRYKINIEDAPIEVAEGVDGTYTNEVIIWVEPQTGAIQNQSQNQQRYLEDGTQVLNLQAEFTPTDQEERCGHQGLHGAADPRHPDRADRRLRRRRPVPARGDRPVPDGESLGLSRKARRGDDDAPDAAGPVRSPQATRVATNTAVPGVSTPRTRLQPPQVRSWSLGHSGSCRSVSTKPLRASAPTQSPSVRWCST